MQEWKGVELVAKLPQGHRHADIGGVVDQWAGVVGGPGAGVRVARTGAGRQGEHHIKTQLGGAGVDAIDHVAGHHVLERLGRGPLGLVAQVVIDPVCGGAANSQISGRELDGHAAQARPFEVVGCDAVFALELGLTVGAPKRAAHDLGGVDGY